jgi:Rps23 Pro-64 3,4-dihydroxylase Tpa1-like proline 4-hydroxylase
MLRLDTLEARAPELARQFATAQPVEHVVIDGFCDADALTQLCDEIPDPIATQIHKSRDYMFARNKFEKSGFKDISPRFAALYEELTGPRFQAVLHTITGQQVFVDPDFHGGGIHQGGEGSYLDMHVDFNTHPGHKDWFRNLNILLYLNPGWQPAYKGQLKLRHRDWPETTVEVEPLFNRCVIMFTRDYTLHGYDAINFPAGQFRRSIAGYAYSPLGDAAVPAHRTTVWYPDNAGAAKTAVGRLWPKIVRLKTALLGSATAKNK